MDGLYWPQKSFKLFIKNLKKSKKIKSFNDIGEFDILISGSDQIWNPQIYGGKMDTNFLLKFNTNARKISYASSFGSYKLDEDNRKVFYECLKDYDTISVREEFAVEQVKRLNINNVTRVCDPTMLLSRDEWNQIICNEECQYDCMKEPYLLVYLVSQYEEYKEQIKEIANLYDLKIAFISYSNIKRENVDYYIKGGNPFQFLKLIKNANLIVTNSFHGTVFSLLFEKEFISLENKHNPERVKTLLNLVGLAERIIKHDDNINDVVNSYSNIDYSRINNKIDTYSNESKLWLINAIK